MVCSVAENQTLQDVSIGSYFAIVWRRKIAVVLAILVAVGLMIAYDSTISPTYKAQSTFQLNAKPQNVNQQVTTAMYTMHSPAVTTIVRTHLGFACPNPTITQQGNSPVMTISIVATDPVEAQQCANAIPRAFNKFHQQQGIIGAFATASILQNEIASAQAQQKALAIAIVKLPKGSPLRIAAVSQLQSVQTSINKWEGLLASLNLNVSQQAGVLLAPAGTPKAPIAPKPTSDAMLAAVVGLAIGVALALLREFMDDKVRNKADLERVFPGFATIGLIPQIREWQDQSTSFLVAAEQPKSPTAEAFRGLRTSLQFLSLDEPVKTLLVTSAAATDGKTTVAANLAYTIASAGQRVIVVGCDLRKPRVHNFFGVSNEQGLTSVLIGDCELDQAVSEVEGIPTLSVLPSGPIPPNPA